MLDISRIESHDLSFEFEPFALRQIISDAVESLRAQAEARRTRLEVAWEETLPAMIVTDRWRVQQVLVNLLDNAIKYSAGGTVTLSARQSVGSDGATVLEFAVVDPGIGMTEAQMRELFEPFFRAQFDTRVRPVGTGLGLAISKRIARKLGGDITVRSEPGAGSTFAFWFPLRPDNTGAESEGPPRRGAGAPADKSKPAASSPRNRLQNARILVADDNEANRQLMSLRLRKQGAEVVLAADGKEALDHVRQSLEENLKIDAVVMDMQMPVLDGYDAVRELRGGGFTQPIIAVTAYAMSEDREECLAIGCDEFVSKPIEWDRFLNKLTKLVAAK